MKTNTNTVTVFVAATLDSVRMDAFFYMPQRRRALQNRLTTQFTTPTGFTTFTDDARSLFESRFGLFMNWLFHLGSGMVGVRIVL